jgi:uncharacterized membrane protein YebE (DUF533 family)
MKDSTGGLFLSNGYGAVALSQSFFDSAVLSGAISIRANGSISFGGILIAVSEVAIASNPIVLTVAGVAVVGTLAYYTYQYYKKQSQAGHARDITKALDRLRQDCGRGLTPEERGRVHDQITGQDLSAEDILAIMKDVIKCR